MLVFLCYNHIIFRITNLVADYVTMEMMVLKMIVTIIFSI